MEKRQLQVSFDIFQGCLANYQQSVKAAIAKYFAIIISRNSHSPKTLFHTINSVLNLVVATCPAPTTAICEDFFNFMSTKINHIQSNIPPPTYDHTLVSACSVILYDFQPLSQSYIFISSFLTQSPPPTPMDIVPTYFFKEVLDTVGPTVLLIINSSLANETVQSCFKHSSQTP